MKAISDICVTDELEVRSNVADLYAMGYVLNDLDDRIAFVAIAPTKGIGYGRATVVTNNAIGGSEIERFIRLFFEPDSHVMVIEYQTAGGQNVYDLWDGLTTEVVE